MYSIYVWLSQLCLTFRTIYGGLEPWNLAQQRRYFKRNRFCQPDWPIRQPSSYSVSSPHGRLQNRAYIWWGDQNLGIDSWPGLFKSLKILSQASLRNRVCSLLNQSHSTVLVSMSYLFYAQCTLYCLCCPVFETGSSHWVNNNEGVIKEKNLRIFHGLFCYEVYCLLAYFFPECTLYVYLLNRTRVFIYIYVYIYFQY